MMMPDDGDDNDITLYDTHIDVVLSLMDRFSFS